MRLLGLIYILSTAYFCEAAFREPRESMIEWRPARSVLWEDRIPWGEIPPGEKSRRVTKILVVGTKKKKKRSRLCVHCSRTTRHHSISVSRIPKTSGEDLAPTMNSRSESFSSPFLSSRSKSCSAATSGAIFNSPVPRPPRIL